MTQLRILKKKMTKHLTLLLFIGLALSEEIVIYSIESAEFYASGGGSSGCCSPSNFGSYNQSLLSTSHCQWWSQYDQCESNARYALWRFDLTDIPENSNILNANILAQGGGNWIQSFMSISDDTGPISLEMASYLRNDGDWSISGQSVITSPVNQIIPNEIINSAYNTGQFCLMFRFYSGYITNNGINAPRLEIEYESQNVTLMGDVNEDGIVNILDIIAIITIINNDAVFIEVADMNYDNNIDIFDLLHIVESF